MINRSNLKCKMDYNAPRLVNSMTLKVETSSINIDPTVDMGLILEHHGIANSVVQYIIEQKYEHIILFETSGSGPHNVQFALNLIQEEYPKLCKILWSDLDNGGFNVYLGHTFGSPENPVLNEFLAAPSIIHAGLRPKNLYDLNVNSAPFEN